MKQVFAVILFLFTGISGLLAQDTTKVIIPAVPTHQQNKDPLLQDKRTLKYRTEIPGYNSINDYNSGYPGNQMTLSFDYPVKKSKTNILNASYSKFIIPTTLISYGVVTRGSKSLQSLDQSTYNEVSEHLNVPIPIDDYSQFVPVVSMDSYGHSNYGMGTTYIF